MKRTLCAVVASGILAAVPSAAMGHHPVPRPKQEKMVKGYAKLYLRADRDPRVSEGRNVLKHGRAKDGKVVWSLVRKEFVRLWKAYHPGDEAEHTKRAQIARITGGYPYVAGADYAHLDRIASCESGHNPRAVSPGGHYRGAWQFAPSTWYAVGGTGDPAAASYAEQKYRAALLWTRAIPSTQWPVCYYR